MNWGHGKSYFVAFALLMAPGLGRAEEAPLLWKSIFEVLEAGSPAPSIRNEVAIQKQDKRSFIQFSNIVQKFLRLEDQIPSGMYLADIVFSFSLRPKEDSFKLCLFLKDSKSGQRCQGDNMLSLQLVFTEKDLSITPVYPDSNEAAAKGAQKSAGKNGKKGNGDKSQLTEAQRDKIEEETMALPGTETDGAAAKTDGAGDLSLRTAKAAPLAVVKEASAVWPQGLTWKNQWHKISVVTDQNLLKISVDGNPVIEHPINPASGFLNISNLRGTNDYAEFEIREIRSAFHPYLEKNLIVETDND